MLPLFSQGGSHTHYRLSALSQTHQLPLKVCYSYYRRWSLLAILLIKHKSLDELTHPSRLTFFFANYQAVFIFYISVGQCEFTISPHFYYTTFSVYCNYNLFPFRSRNVLALLLTCCKISFVFGSSRMKIMFSAGAVLITSLRIVASPGST